MTCLHVMSSKLLKTRMKEREGRTITSKVMTLTAESREFKSKVTGSRVRWLQNFANVPRVHSQATDWSPCAILPPIAAPSAANKSSYCD